MTKIILIFTSSLALLSCSQGQNEDMNKDPDPVQPVTYKIIKPKDDDNITWEVIQVMWNHANFYDTEQEYLKSIKPATKGQLAVYASTWYLSEVNNGGHDQFYSNSTGMVAEDAARGLKILGATEHLAIINKANGLFPNSSPSKGRERRNKQLDAINSDELDKLDNKLYELMESYDALVTKYILDHPDEFFLEK